MNTCFFCGPTERQLTKEHVWPKWVSKLLRSVLHGDHFRQLRATGHNTTGNRQSRYIDVTTDVVCSDCNNVWLSSFENDQIKPLASQMIVGDGDLDLSLADQSVLAAWAYKMVLLLEIANPRFDGAFFTAPERLLFRRSTQAHPLVRVFLARYDSGNRPGHAVVAIHTFTERFGEQRTLSLMPATVTVGNLAMQVLAVRPQKSPELISAFEMEFELLGKARKAVVPIWPPNRDRVTWPPQATMDHNDVEDWSTMWTNPGN